jgi:hypothetical protein
LPCLLGGGYLFSLSAAHSLVPQNHGGSWY